jgi:hypothetical protein
LILRVLSREFLLKNASFAALNRRFTLHEVQTTNYELKTKSTKRIYYQHLLGVEEALYMLAYYTKSCDEPVILLTDMLAETFDLALRIHNRFTKGWDCEGSSRK